MKTQHINLWDAADRVTKRKFIALKAFIRKEERSWNNNPSFCLEKAEKEEWIKSKSSKRKEIKRSMKINKTETRKTIEKINKTKVVSLNKYQQNGWNFR